MARRSRGSGPSPLPERGCSAPCKPAAYAGATREMLSPICPRGFGTSMQRRLACGRRAFVFLRQKNALSKMRYLI